MTHTEQDDHSNDHNHENPDRRIWSPLVAILDTVCSQT